MEIKNKKAFFFTTDATIALSIILAFILVAYPASHYIKQQSSLGKDVLSVLSELKISEINNDYVQELITEGKITNLDNSVLEQIAEFYTIDKQLAENLANELMKDMITNKNIGIWYDNGLVYSKNTTPYTEAKSIQTNQQWITALKSGENVTGYSSRVFLSSSLKTDYHFFGGYIGDGNISLTIPFYGNLTEVTLELSINDNFDLYINGAHQGNYEKSEDEFTPIIYSLPLTNFISGTNLIEFKGNNLAISGGFLKITYTPEAIFQEKTRMYLPGIDGLINLYDGISISSELNEMTIYLHYDSNYTLFLNMGNTTIYNGSSEQEKTVTITNSELSNLLNYGELANKTIPLRLGMQNVSYILGIKKPVDVYSVTDLSGSMDYCSELYTCSYNCWIGGSKSCQIYNLCSSSPCGGTCWFPSGYSPTCPSNPTLVDLAKEANKNFINVVFENEENKVGLIGYATNIISSAFHNLSTNQSSLYNKIDSWTASGSTCICCGIQDAIVRLNSTTGNDNRMKVVVVMSDGEANYNCAGGTSNAKQAAIDKACEAYRNYNITVHSVGFGDNADENTLQSIANCGNGSYYYGNSSELAELYSKIAQDIIEASYVEQTIETTGNISTRLYPDSYIEFNRNEEESPYGMALTLEQEFQNKTGGIFTIPENSSILNANVISYSGPRWTSKVKINNEEIYNIFNYQTNLIELGDPYKINIPIDKINQTNTNNVELYTATSPSENINGSEHNKIIYNILKNVASYSPISSSAQGCIWEIEFEDETNATLIIPKDYSGTETCKYSAGEISYNSNDANQLAVYRLFKELDFNQNNKVNFKFSENNIEISSSRISGIPFTLTNKVEIRIWD